MSRPERPSRILSILGLLKERFTNPEMIEELESYITELEARQPPTVANGKYKPRFNYEVFPDKTAPIEWEQPARRYAPVWSHEVTCPYCGVTERIETHSPHAPGNCGKDECLRQHERALARERKRRQRARQKLSRRDNKT